MLKIYKKRAFLAAQEGRFVDCSWLRPLSGLWALTTACKHFLYDRRLLSVVQLPVPVVSIGAITAGGSGKTPLVHLLAQSLQPFGRIAVLSRGYRARQSGLALGDEGTLLKRRLPNVDILIGKDRVASGKEAIRRGAQLLLLDDGLQYRRLYRDVEIIALDAAQPFGFGAYLPRGLLRDSVKRLAVADLLIGHLPDCPVTVGMRVTQPRDLKGKRVGVFCAIAHPKRFLETLRQEGASVVDHWFLPDHDLPSVRDLHLFAGRAAALGASCLVCTEKDAVKLEKMSLDLALPLVVVEVELELIKGEAIWRDLIEKIALKMNNRSI